MDPRPRELPAPPGSIGEVDAVLTQPGHCRATLPSFRAQGAPHPCACTPHKALCRFRPSLVVSTLGAAWGPPDGHSDLSGAAWGRMACSHLTLLLVPSIQGEPGSRGPPVSRPHPPNVTRVRKAPITARLLSGWTSHPSCTFKARDGCWRESNRSCLLPSHRALPVHRVRTDGLGTRARSASPGGR